MSDASIGGSPSAIERLAPYVLPRRDRVLPILIFLSLCVHATVFLPSLFHRDAKETPRQEIPVEIVQLPPKAAEKPKPPTPKPPAQKPAPPKPATQAPQKQQQAAPKPQPKTEPSKPEQPKPAPKQQKAEAKHQPKPEPKSQPKPQVAQKPSQSQQPSGAERMKQLLGPMPAIALPGASADGSDAVDYTQLVLSRVAKAKKQGRYNGIPGASGVAFTLGNTGELVDVHIVKPSGDPSLDEEAIAMVRRGAPYPVPPPGGRRDYAITLRFHAL